MPIDSLIVIFFLLLFIVAVCLSIAKRLPSPSRKPKRKSRFGFYPVAAGNALQALQAIVEPSARHTLAIRFEEQAEEDDSSDPNDPTQHLHRQAARIRRGEPIGRLSALLPARPSASAPPS